MQVHSWRHDVRNNGPPYKRRKYIYSFAQIIFGFYFVEALVYQKIGLYKGDQYYHLGTILADKFAKGSRDVS